MKVSQIYGCGEKGHVWFIFCVLCLLFSAWAMELKSSISHFYTEPLPTEVVSKCFSNERLLKKIIIIK